MFEENIQQELFGPPVFRVKVNESVDNEQQHGCLTGFLEFSCFYTQDEGKTYQVILYLLEMARISSW